MKEEYKTLRTDLRMVLGVSGGVELHHFNEQGKRAGIVAIVLWGVVALPLFVSGCSRATDDPNSRVVQLRNTLIGFAHGKIDEITIQTEPGEAFVLLSGYPEREIRPLTKL